MSLTDEIKRGVGYAVVKTDDIALMELARDLICDAAIAKLGMLGDVEVIRQKLSGLSGVEINGLNCIPNKDWALMLTTMLKAFKTSIVEISGENLFVQRRPYLLCNVPNDPDTSNRHPPTMPHIEAMSGVAPHTITFWAPLHDVEDNTGLWIIDQHQSMDLLNKEKDTGRVMGENILDINSPGMRGHKFISMAFGEAIIFNPFCLHGSVLNMTKRSRISMTFRFQSRSEKLFLKGSEYFTPYDLNSLQR